MALEYSAKEFIKMYRKFLSWEWYTDTNTKSLFLHCLLRANWKPGEWQGVHYEAGEFITSLPSLAKESGLTVHQVRTSLNHLISTGEVASRCVDEVSGKSIPKGRIITINNWDEYQGSGRQAAGKASGNVAGERQAGVRQVAADKEYKEDIRTYKKKKEAKEAPTAISSNEEQKMPEDALPNLDDIEEIDFSQMSSEEFERWIREHGNI